MNRRILFLSITLIVAVALTGCGSKDKKLTCSVTSDDAKFLMLGDNQEAVATFKKDELSSISMKMVVKASSKEQAETYKEQFEQIESGSSKFQRDTKVEGTDLVITEKIEDITKLNDEEKKDLFGEDISYDGLKKYYENQGYNCK